MRAWVEENPELAQRLGMTEQNESDDSSEDVGPSGECSGESGLPAYKKRPGLREVANASQEFADMAQLVNERQCDINTECWEWREIKGSLEGSKNSKHREILESMKALERRKTEGGAFLCLAKLYAVEGTEGQKHIDEGAEKTVMFHGRGRKAPPNLKATDGAATIGGMLDNLPNPFPAKLDNPDPHKAMYGDGYCFAMGPHYPAVFNFSKPEALKKKHPGMFEVAICEVCKGDRVYAQTNQGCRGEHQLVPRFNTYNVSDNGMAIAAKGREDYNKVMRDHGATSIEYSTYGAKCVVLPARDRHATARVKYIAYLTCAEGEHPVEHFPCGDTSCEVCKGITTLKERWALNKLFTRSDGTVMQRAADSKAPGMFLTLSKALENSSQRLLKDLTENEGVTANPETGLWRYLVKIHENNVKHWAQCGIDNCTTCKDALDSAAECDQANQVVMHIEWHMQHVEEMRRLTKFEGGAMMVDHLGGNQGSDGAQEMKKHLR